MKSLNQIKELALKAGFNIEDSASDELGVFIEFDGKSYSQWFSSYDEEGTDTYDSTPSKEEERLQNMLCKNETRAIHIRQFLADVL